MNQQEKTGTRREKEFIFEDSEIPDLVLEIIIEFVAKETAKEKWGEIQRVSKRWNRISKPILREVFRQMWPKFIVPKIMTEAMVMEISSDRTKVFHPKNTEYHWCFVEPLPLRSVVESGKPVGVVINLSECGGVCVGAFLMDDKTVPELEKELAWSPFSSHFRRDAFETHDVTIALIGACSGDIIVHDFAGVKSTFGVMKAHQPKSNLGSCENWPYEIAYHPSGLAKFLVKGNCEFTGEAQLNQEEMMKRHGNNAILTFAVGISSENRSASLSMKHQH